MAWQGAEIPLRGFAFAPGMVWFCRRYGNPMERLKYCHSRFETVRRRSRVVRVGTVMVGGDNPIVVQSMTTTPTQDVAATVAQSIALAEAGCEMVRITAQNLKAAQALKEIRKAFSAAGFAHIPLVADIHFLPNTAMEAALHVEKVRINPGNYADKKKFEVVEYSDAEYNAELERLHEAFSPIVLRCKELGRAMRIGTNHGSLSDRIMNRYGDTPLGMCESALEFLRIAESHGYHDIILSMKASNPKVMIQAYRLMVARMAQENMHYPLHLGVTEAGDGDDARIKSAIGIGSLLVDGLGDTIRVSLTEDPVAEIPVARAMANKAMAAWRTSATRTEPDPVDPFSYTRRRTETITIGLNSRIAPLEPPRVIQPYPPPASTGALAAWCAQLADTQASLKDAQIEGLLLDADAAAAAIDLAQLRGALDGLVDAVIWECRARATAEQLPSASRTGDIWLLSPELALGNAAVRAAATAAQVHLAVAITPAELAAAEPAQLTLANRPLILAARSDPAAVAHAPGQYRQLAEVADAIGAGNPIWIRCREDNRLEPATPYGFGDRLLEASILAGSLLCDGIGDLISVETVPSPRQSTTLAYNILQGARCRSVKTEFVACPSCGRTLFDLQSTTQRIRAATGHLKGVTIAVMGCIVNGPGEMADADFGYVGGSPGKINLYVGKTCVRYHVPTEEAVDALIALIREHGKWVEP